MAIEFRPASALSWAQLAELFNASYEGYVVPVQMTEAQIRAHVHNHDVLLEHSPVAYADAQPVGLAALARRNDGGWVAGIGVIASRRQQGIGKRLLNALLENACALGLTSVQLEVNAGNDAARNLYLRAGFRDTRDLLVIAREPGPVAAPVWRGSFEKSTLERALTAYERLHAVPNPWQRQRESLLNQTSAPAAWLALDDGDIQAYAIGFFSAERLVLQDIGASPTHPEAVAALFAHLHTIYPEARASLVNLDSSDPAWPALEQLGYQVTLRQHEMRVALTGSPQT